MKKKIGFCINSLDTGGAEKLLIDIIDALYKTGLYEIFLLTKYKSNSEFFNEIKNKVKYRYLISKNIETKNKKYLKLGSLLNSMLKMKNFKNFEKEVDTVIDFLDGDFYKFMKKSKNKEKIIWLHSGYEDLKIKKKIDQKLKIYDKKIVITEEMNQEIKLKTNLDKVYMIYNLIDYDKIDYLLKQELAQHEKKLFEKEYFLTVCRLNENEKDVKTLLKAFSEYKGNELLYIVGDGPSREELEKVTADLNIEERVFFLGKKYNPFIYMKNAKAFILSTKFEGFGLVVAEALYCGTKVISSDCDFGPREILLSGEIGELFKVGDAKDLLEKMNTIEEKVYSKEKIAQSLKRFTKKEILEKIEGVINV
ncbi:MAG: glycosyltransferase [Cetobacterium sp.]